MRLGRLIDSAKRIDWQLFIAAMLLVAVSLVIQYSLGLNNEDRSFSFFRKQLISFGVGLLAFFVMSFFDFRALRNYAYPFYAVGILLLIAVLFFGQTLRGTRGWLVIGPFGFQVVELVKLLVVVALARFWSSVSFGERPAIKKIIISIFLVFLPVSLILLQPDLGSTLMLFVLWLGLFLLIDRHIPHFVVVLFLFLLAGVLAWFFFLAPYQKDRLLTFIMPGQDPLGVGYQVTQSIIAVGSGKFFGRGLGLGPQSQLRFLPDSNTDFVFSVIAEEFGFLGCLVVFGLYIFLLYRIIKILKLSYDNFSLLLVLGVIIFFYSQIFINIGMNLGIMPVTGIPLPLVSYGGSFLVITLATLGLLESIAVHGSR